MLFFNQSSLIPGNFSLKLEGGNGHGVVNTNIRRYSSVVGSDTLSAYATYADNANDGMSVTILQSGWYIIYVGDFNSTTDAAYGISLNSNQLTTSINSITNTTRMCVTDNPNGNICSSTGTFRYFVVNDVIRTHTNGNTNGMGIKVWFYMAKVA